MITKKEAAIISAYTGVLVGNFDEMHKYIEQLLKRPVFTHELANKNTMDEIHRRSKKDFCGLVVVDGTPAEDRYGREPGKSTCGDCRNFKLVSKGGQKASLNCERVGYGTKADNNSCDRFELKPKPLAQYLAEYLDYEGDILPAEIEDSKELLEQALDAYESTENVRIKIKKC